MYFFFFKQKTAYEMRISDWSSDVCSSDLSTTRAMCLKRHLGCHPRILRDDLQQARRLKLEHAGNDIAGEHLTPVVVGHDPVVERLPRKRDPVLGGDRKRGVEGRRLSVRVDPGGRRIIKKKTK